MLQLKFYTVLLTLVVLSSLAPTVFGAGSYNPPQNVAKSGDFVTLSGNGIDPDDDALTISWKQTGGEKVQLMPSANVAEPTFQAPEVENGKVKILTFELTVKDPYGGVDTDLIKITIMPRNQPPTADAGSDQTVSKGDEVTLEGSGSDPDGDALTYHWNQVDGPIVALANPDSQNPTLDTSDMERSTGTLRYQLVVTDGYGGLDTDIVAVKVEAANPTLISADAGKDQTVNEGDSVQLDGSCTDKMNRDMSYTWTQTLGPFVQLSSNSDPDPTFVAPEIPNGAVVPLGFRFSCNAAEGGGTATDVVIIRVKPTNDDPTADAGSDKETSSHRIQYLTGSGSDPDGDRLTYSWKQTGGDKVDIINQNSAIARFLTPDVSGGASTELKFQLTAKDPYGGTGTDEMMVTVVSNNVRASSDAGPDQVVDEQSKVTLTGTGEDPDSDKLTYAWKQIAGEKVELSSTDDASPSFVAPMVDNGKLKVLVFELRVADESGVPSKDTTKVTVMPVNTPPTADAGAGQTVDIGNTVVLSGSANDDDGDSLTVLWNQISGPAVTLSSENDLLTTFTAPKVSIDTTLSFQLVANDGQADSAPSTVDIKVIGEVSKKITANAGKDQKVSEGDTVSLVGTGKDPLKHKLTYTWKQLSGDRVDLTSTSGAKTTFVAPDVSNGHTKNLTFELTVSDGEGRTAKDTVTVTVGPINGDPTAVAKVKTIREAV